MFRKTIGILGGMGPVASADTYTELIKICQQQYGAVQDSDFPAVILYSLPLKEFDHKGFSNDSTEQKAIVSQLANALQKLKNIGAEVIILDCNTVHYFFGALQKGTEIPIINLISITVDHIVKNGYKKVAVLCSQTSKDFSLYTKPLERRGVSVLNTSEDEQKFVNEAILAVMSGSVTPLNTAHLNSLINKFLKGGAQSIILGCTEISNIAKLLSHNAILVDSEVLAIEKALAFAR